jgi:hypothetical protein
MQLLGVSAACVGLLVSCSGGDDADDSSARSTTTSPMDSGQTTTTFSTDDQVVVDAYLAAENAAVAAASPPTPNPDDPQLAATHTGPMLQQRKDVFSGLRDSGLAIRLPENSQTRETVSSIEYQGDDVAILDVCAVDDGERIVVASGEVVASGLATVEWTAAMQRQDGTWKLAEREEQNRWEGEAGCALDSHS